MPMAPPWVLFLSFVLDESIIDARHAVLSVAPASVPATVPATVYCVLKRSEKRVTLGAQRQGHSKLLFQDPLGDLMVLGRTGLDMKKTLNNDPLATLSKNGPDRPETSPTLTGRPCLRAWGVYIYI